MDQFRFRVNGVSLFTGKRTSAMDNTIVWIIIAGFYAPLHFIPPVLLVLFKTHDEMRAFCMKRSLIDSTISMTLAFGLVYLVGLDNMLLAMSILLIALAMPYLRVVKVIMRNRRVEEAG
jgi:hypothetical protein